MTAPVGRLLSVVFECADTGEEARFWTALLGWERHHDTVDWATVTDPGTHRQRLSFQRVDDHTPPTWPARDRPQQAHVDLLVADLATADTAALALGARRLTGAPVEHVDERFHVYADPAGHPFCLIQQQDPDLPDRPV